MTIGTRGSPLALAQARQLRDALAQHYGIEPLAIEITVIRTSGDMIQDRALAAAGGKGLFTKELDIALLNGAIDVAVHSSKDLPTLLPDGLCICGYLPREDVRDVLICPGARKLEDLPPKARLGTASLRRGALVRRVRPDVNIVLLRGNVETRLTKIEAGEADATLLALAGLKRLGLQDRADVVLDAASFPPAAGQGAIGITARSGDEVTYKRIGAINHLATDCELKAERAFLDVVDGSCRTPIAGLARVSGGSLDFYGLVLRPDGAEFYDIRQSGTCEQAEDVGRLAGEALRAKSPANLFGS